MSNMGWLDDRRWRGGADWRECVNWGGFNSVILNNISDNRRGLNLRDFRTELQESQDAFVQNSRQPAEPARIAAVPRREEPEEQPVLRDSRGRLTDVAWARLSGTVSRPESVDEETWKKGLDQLRAFFDSRQELTEEYMMACLNIYRRGGNDIRSGGELRLTLTNLRAFRSRMEERGMSSSIAGDITDHVYVIVDGMHSSMEALRRRSTFLGEPTPLQPRVAEEKPRTPRPERRDQAAPQREQNYVYSVTFRDTSGERIAFLLESPRRITNENELVAALRDPDSGVIATRTEGGREVRINNLELAAQVETLARDPISAISINEEYTIDRRRG